jgi:hypothetical protein
MGAEKARPQSIESLRNRNYMREEKGIREKHIPTQLKM